MQTSSPGSRHSTELAASQLFRDLVQEGYAGSRFDVILWGQARREVHAPTTPDPQGCLRLTEPKFGAGNVKDTNDDSQNGVLIAVFVS